MKQASFVLSIIATVAWLYIEKKVRYITTNDNV